MLSTSFPILIILHYLRDMWKAISLGRLGVTNVAAFTLHILCFWSEATGLPRRFELSHICIECPSIFIRCSWAKKRSSGVLSYPVRYSIQQSNQPNSHCLVSVSMSDLDFSSDFDDPNNNNGAGIAFIITCLTIATTSFIIRVYVKFIDTKGYHIGDRMHP